MTYSGKGKEGKSGNPGFSSYPNGVFSIAGNFKDSFRDKIGTSEEHPPVVFLHGTEDPRTPYDNIKAFYDQAQSVKLPSTMITLEGADHDIFLNDEVLANPYFTDLTTGLY